MQYSPRFLVAALAAVFILSTFTARADYAASIEQLSAQQLEDGSWPAAPDAVTATNLAVKALVLHAIEDAPGMGLSSPFDASYPYREHINKGIGYLLSTGQSVDIGMQAAGDPDTNANGHGICLDCGGPNETYATSITLMTVCSVSGFDQTVAHGALAGKTYERVAHDMLDFLLFAQIDSGPNQGGWGATANSLDQAALGHSAPVMMALQFAGIPRPDGCGLAVPEFVETELEAWLARDSKASEPFQPAQAKVATSSFGSFRDLWKQCPEDWLDSGYIGDQPPLCFQMLEDYAFSIPLAYFSSKLFDYENLPVTPDPRSLVIFWRNKSRGDDMNDYIDAKLPPGGVRIDLDTPATKMYFSLESDGTMRVKKGYRWDGPTTRPVPKPDDYQDVLMNATLIHDTMYDLMRMGLIDREDSLLPPLFKWSHDGFRNRVLADNLFYMISLKDSGDARPEFWWFTVRFGGWAKTKESMPSWKVHALAEAGHYPDTQCAAPEGAWVNLDGSASRYAMTWDWSWEQDGVLKTVSGEKPLPQLFTPGTYTVDLEVNCTPAMPGCHEYYVDSDQATFSVATDPEPPVIEPIDDIVAKADAQRCDAVVEYSPDATDNCGIATVSCSKSSGSLFPVGDTAVTCTARDDAGFSDTTAFVVSVHDTQAPSIVAPADVVAECTGASGTPVILEAPVVSDNCDSSPIIANNAPPRFPTGTTTVTWNASDVSGNRNTDDQLVTIVDTTPPTLSLDVSPATLWPPNHKLVTIVPTVSGTDACDGNPVIRLVSITSNEPANTKGDGNTDKDIKIIDDFNFMLRAERSGKGSGREYTITYEVEDASGNTASASAIVTVAHNRN